MSSSIFFAPDHLEWKRAYMAAVLEKDRSRLPELIHKAREEVAERLRGLRAQGRIPSEEIEAMQDALYMLEALLSSLLCRDETGEWARSDQDF